MEKVRGNATSVVKVRGNATSVVKVRGNATSVVKVRGTITSEVKCRSVIVFIHSDPFYHGINLIIRTGLELADNLEKSPV